MCILVYKLNSVICVIVCSNSMCNLKLLCSARLHLAWSQLEFFFPKHWHWCLRLGYKSFFLNIAHHKSYQPYCHDNTERIRKDEEEARRNEEYKLIQGLGTGWLFFLRFDSAYSLLMTEVHYNGCHQGHQESNCHWNRKGYTSRTISHQQNKTFLEVTWTAWPSISKSLKHEIKYLFNCV